MCTRAKVRIITSQDTRYTSARATLLLLSRKCLSHDCALLLVSAKINSLVTRPRAIKILLQAPDAALRRERPADTDIIKCLTNANGRKMATLNAIPGEIPASFLFSLPIYSSRRFARGAFKASSNEVYFEGGGDEGR